MNELINLDDFERAALAKLPAGPRDYYAGGALDEITLRENRAAWSRWNLHYRVLRDVSGPDFGTELLGMSIDWPVIIAPTAFQCMAHPDGEVATGRAAADSGTAMVLSTLANKPLEQVAAAATRGLWFQLYVFRDRGVTRELIARVEAAGCRAIAVTVDAPMGGQRERDLRNDFAFPATLAATTLMAASARPANALAMDGAFMSYANAMFDPTLTWKDLEWICAQTRLPVLIKGVVRSDDALQAAGHGARGVIVSNHGGRQLDTAPPGAEVL
jgi:4-hydroxymandelate oxidase